jgi:hypothetical protein
MRNFWMEAMNHMIVTASEKFSSSATVICTSKINHLLCVQELQSATKRRLQGVCSSVVLLSLQEKATCARRAGSYHCQLKGTHYSYGHTAFLPLRVCIMESTIQLMNMIMMYVMTLWVHIQMCPLSQTTVLASDAMQPLYCETTYSAWHVAK